MRLRRAYKVVTGRTVDVIQPDWCWPPSPGFLCSALGVARQDSSMKELKQVGFFGFLTPASGFYQRRSRPESAAPPHIPHHCTRRPQTVSMFGAQCGTSQDGDHGRVFEVDVLCEAGRGLCRVDMAELGGRDRLMEQGGREPLCVVLRTLFAHV